MWWISSTKRLDEHFGWRPKRSILDIMQEIHEEGIKRWGEAS